MPEKIFSALHHPTKEFRWQRSASFWPKGRHSPACRCWCRGKGCEEEIWAKQQLPRRTQT